jgi:transcription-repair coupling factor (superfamily II helicase)
LNLGFESDEFLLIGEQALFGEKIFHKNRSKSASQRVIEEGLTINQGELIVHRDHGIGKFDGIHTIEAANIKTDMIRLLYGGGDVEALADLGQADDGRGRSALIGLLRRGRTIVGPLHFRDRGQQRPPNFPSRATRLRDQGR